LVGLDNTTVALKVAVDHTDGLGSVRALTSEDGTVFQTYRTDEFGVPILSDSLGASLQPFQFTGEQRDLETGFVYLRSRYYAPEIGRFISRDPWPGVRARPGSVNRYVYVQDSPTFRIDPSGYKAMALLSDWPSDVALAEEPLGAAPCPARLSVQGVQSSFAGNLFGGYLTASFSLLRTPDGQFGAAFAKGGGGGTGVIGLTAGVGPVFSNARNLSDYGGVFGGVGGAIGFPLSFGVNTAIGTAAETCTIAVVVPEVALGSNISIAGIAPLPAEAHGFATDTWIQPW